MSIVGEGYECNYPTETSISLLYYMITVEITDKHYSMIRRLPGVILLHLWRNMSWFFINLILK